PERATFAAWARRAPLRFEFAVKASRFLTHMKKLKDPEEPIERLFSRMRALGTRLGPVLYQLPPGWKADAARFEIFLDALPRDVAGDARLAATARHQFRRPRRRHDGRVARPRPGARPRPARGGRACRTAGARHGGAGSSRGGPGAARRMRHDLPVRRSPPRRR